MQKQEFTYYNELRNWNFSDIKYTVEQESDWDFYSQITKYSNKNSFILDLGTGGGEESIKNMPDVRYGNWNRFLT